MNDALDRRLLVPMNIEALVIGASPRTDWVNLKPDFRGVYLNEFLGQQLETDPCSTKDAGLNREPGIHLHWALPDGLTHGVAREDGEDPEFPSIPNRWLVLRLWDGTEDQPESTLRSKAWIVESDVITGSDAGAVWPNLRAAHPNPEDEQDYAVRVGRQFELAQWPGETSAPSIDINALGYGDPSFAAYYPASRGMLGFHDDELDDVPVAGLTYVVAGWYSAPEKDPLHRALTERTFARLDDFLGEAKWIYPGYAEAAASVQRGSDVEASLREAREMAVRISAARPTAQEEQAELQRHITELETEHQALAGALEALQQDLPDQIVCHGIISGIQWRGKDALYESGIPRGRPFTVAVGNTAVEALAALFKTELDSDVAKLLEAFQYDLLTDLERPGGDDTLEQKIHERTYRARSRGIRWDLIQETAFATGGATQDSAPPIPGDIRLLLEDVNIAQREINRLKRERDSRKSELYATWYKSVLDTSVASLPRHMMALQQEIDGLTSQITALEDEEGRPLGVQWDALHATLDVLLPGYTLRPLDEVRFWRPQDPVVLLAGQAFQRVYRHGEDGRYRSDGRLLCRLSGQEITSTKISIPNARVPNVEFGPADLDRWCDPLPDAQTAALSPGVQTCLRRLFHETLMLTLDAKRARDVASAAYEKNEAGLSRDHPAEVSQLARDLLQYVQQGWDEDAPRVSMVFTCDGVFPSPIVMNRWLNNPWLPLFLQWQVSWSATYADPAGALQGWTLNRTGTAFEGDPGAAADPLVYGGTTLLTPGAALHFADRMRQYNLTHDNPQLRAFQTAVGSMSLLCQTLGGFTDNLLMRKGRLEFRPLDPGAGDRGPQPSAIFDWVRDIDWLAPLADTAFFPLRAGHLALEKLWVIDAFGQLLQLEEEDVGKLTAPVVHERLASSAGGIRLEPRLAQPARLTIEWLPANRSDATEQPNALGDDEEFDPVCGWIVPNLLDRGLMIHDARGHALGALQAVQRKSWDQGVGARREEIESFHWVDIPGSSSFFFGKPPAHITDPLGPDANPHLRRYVRALLSLTGDSGAAFGRLLDQMDEALSAPGGGGSSSSPGLALLIGRPLALVRARLRLELDGYPALAQGWDAVEKDAKDRTGGIEKVRFPIRLGDRRLWNGMWLGDDGLVGFFLDQDYSRFYPAYGLQGRDDVDSRDRWTPQISIDEPLDLTLLMSPSQGVCATTGILPRIIFQLPYGDITETLENKQVIFFTGPLVSTAAAVRMPRPSDLYGQWSWTHHPAVEVWREESITDTQKEEGRFFDDSLQIAEGWLKLMTAPVAIRTFTVKGLEPVTQEQKPAKTGDAPIPARFDVTSGERIVLSWVTIGAEDIELKEGTTSLVKSSRHPLPQQCHVQVNQNTSFTLIAIGRTEHPAESQETAHTSDVRTIDIRIVAAKAT